MQACLKSLVFVAMVLAVAACARNKQLVPTGGSRADGTVTLSYEYGGFEKPQVDMQQGIAAARARCQAWGYQDAEPFGGQTEKCQRMTEYGCVRALVNVNFQCVGANRPN